MLEMLNTNDLSNLCAYGSLKSHKHIYNWRNIILIMKNIANACNSTCKNFVISERCHT